MQGDILQNSSGRSSEHPVSRIDVSSAGQISMEVRAGLPHCGSHCSALAMEQIGGVCQEGETPQGEETLSTWQLLIKMAGMIRRRLMPMGAALAQLYGHR